VSGAIVVFAREPRPGLAKTRMTPPFTPEEAADLYAQMLDDVLEATARFARQLALAPVVAAQPPEACAALAQRAPSAFRVVAQRGEDLGQRMTWALAETAAGGFAPVLLRGSDSPALGLEALTAALDALREVDVAACPDPDGGYNLVGVRAPEPGLFEHPMSTGSALADLLADAHGLGLRTRVLEPCFDLDTAADLARLARVRSGPAATLCRRTLGWLDASQGWQRATRDLPAHAQAGSA
jgi:uncharacterized protein